MVFITTFNNISFISWLSVLLVAETGLPRENHQPAVSHWQTWSNNVVSSTPCHEQGSNWLAINILSHLTIYIYLYFSIDHIHRFYFYKMYYNLSNICNFRQIYLILMRFLDKIQKTENLRDQSVHLYLEVNSQGLDHKVVCFFFICWKKI